MDAPDQADATPLFSIGADGVDTDAIMTAIHARVAAKKANGDYDDLTAAMAERFNFDEIKDDDEFLPLYLQSLQQAVFIDIGDFEIIERRARFSKPLIKLKQTIWSLLKFYTYRLWSQQNQVNGLLLNTLESIESRDRTRTVALEKRVAQLEARLDAAGIGSDRE
jgi:hypothetical protein